jgi:hypothetical protein
MMRTCIQGEIKRKVKSGEKIKRKLLQPEMDERVIQSLMAVMRGGAVGSGGASSEPGRQPQQPQQQQLAPQTQQQAYLQQQLALQQFAALLTAYPSLFANLDPQTALQWQVRKRAQSILQSSVWCIVHFCIASLRRECCHSISYSSYSNSCRQHNSKATSNSSLR